MKSWLQLDHQVYSEIKKAGILNRKFLVCVSGGVDSVALAIILERILPRDGGQDRLQFFHFHHGPFQNKNYRDRAQKFVCRLGQDLDIDVHVATTSLNLKSEKEFREARLAALGSLGVHESTVIVWGHQAQDLLETRLIRLIRGAGPLGIQGMRVWRKPHFRPLLGISRDEIVKYMQVRGMAFLEDPTNFHEQYLRNWLRQNWLPALEAKRPGSLGSLAQSLESLAQLAQGQSLASEFLDLLPGLKGDPSKVFLDRDVLLTMSQFDQTRALALLLFRHGCRGFRQSHIQEILKHLDNGRKDHSIRVTGLNIHINAERIWVES